MSQEKIEVEVAYALPDRQSIVQFTVDSACTAAQAAEQSGIAQQFADLDLSKVKLGIFGKAVKADYVMQAGDRVEIYRPLIADPKATRKARAEKVRSSD